MRAAPPRRKDLQTVKRFHCLFLKIAGWEAADATYRYGGLRRSVKKAKWLRNSNTLAVERKGRAEKSAGSKERNPP